MSVADLYFETNPEQDAELFREMQEQCSKEGEELMKLMPAWKRWGYDEGIEEGLQIGLLKGIEQGFEQGIEQGRKEANLTKVRKLSAKGFSPEEIAETLELPVNEVCRLMGQPFHPVAFTDDVSGQ